MAADLDPAPKGPGRLRVFVMALAIGGIPVVGLALAYWFAVGWQRDTDPQVRAVLLRQQEAWNAGDLERFMEDYWESDELTFFSEGNVTKGYTGLQERYRKRYQSEGKEMGTLTFSDLDVTPMGASYANARGRWKVVTSKGTFDGLFTLTLYRFRDGWKITHDHTSQSEKKP